ncbi:MAG: AI-2E family transporter [Actinomycetota bacterium]|nr:AI-2E family transporter [Actinomycetota bacterium]
MAGDQRPVPVRAILAAIGLVLACAIGLYLVVLLRHIETLLVIAAFFAIVLNQPVEFLRRHVRLSRGLATAVVYLVGVALFAGMLYAFISPLVTQVQHFADNFPRYVTEAKAGKGPVGGIVKRYKLDQTVERNKGKIQKWLSSAGGGAFKVAKAVANGLLSMLTILVLSILMIVYGPELLEGGLGILSPPRRERVRAVAADCSRALTGYVMGNLLISVIAGVVTFVALLAFGVPFRGVLALWVGFADLIPLVGATLGAIPTVGVAFLHSPTAGFGMIIVYVVYQQFENHVLQVAIMSRTVQINQLFVLVSVLIGVELMGFVGALLAIPAAGVIQVIARDVWDHRRGRFKEEPTIGEDMVPVSEHLAAQEDDDSDDEAPLTDCDDDTPLIGGDGGETPTDKDGGETPSAETPGDGKGDVPEPPRAGHLKA